MPYTPVGWKDYPNEETPVSAANLNHMDNQIKENTEKLDNFNPELPSDLMYFTDSLATEQTTPRDADTLAGFGAEHYGTKDDINALNDNLTQIDNKKLDIFDLGIVKNNSPINIKLNDDNTSFILIGKSLSSNRHLVALVGGTKSSSNSTVISSSEDASISGSSGTVTVSSSNAYGFPLNILMLRGQISTQ